LWTPYDASDRRIRLCYGFMLSISELSVRTELSGVSMCNASPPPPPPRRSRPPSPPRLPRGPRAVPLSAREPRAAVARGLVPSLPQPSPPARGAMEGRDHIHSARRFVSSFSSSLSESLSLSLSASSLAAAAAWCVHLQFIRWRHSCRLAAAPLASRVPPDRRDNPFGLGRAPWSLEHPHGNASRRLPVHSNQRQADVLST